MVILMGAMPAIGACDQPDAPATRPVTSRNEPIAAAPVSFERETKAFTFTYDYPAQAAAIPALTATLATERAKALAELEASSSQALAQSQGSDYQFNAHLAGISWKVTGDTSALLAMVAEISSFAGGAHGNTGYDAMIWDKAAARRVALDALFVDPAAAMDALRQPYCDALDADRAARRAEYEVTGDDMFSACPPFSELVIVPFAGSDGGFDRMMLLAAPYVAGPYVEGAYEISLPLTDATLDQLKPRYRKAFTRTAQ